MLECSSSWLFQLIPTLNVTLSSGERKCYVIYKILTQTMECDAMASSTKWLRLCTLPHRLWFSIRLFLVVVARWSGKFRSLWTLHRSLDRTSVRMKQLRRSIPSLRSIGRSSLLWHHKQHRCQQKGWIARCLFQLYKINKV